MGLHSRPQGPRSFWSAPRIATSGLVQQRKSAILGLPVTLRMLRVKSNKSDWFWLQSIVFTKPFKTRDPFLEIPGKLTALVSYFEIEVSRKVGCVLNSHEVHVVYLAENFRV